MTSSVEKIDVFCQLRAPCEADQFLQDWKRLVIVCAVVILLCLRVLVIYICALQYLIVFAAAGKQPDESDQKNEYVEKAVGVHDLGRENKRMSSFEAIP